MIEGLNQIAAIWWQWMSAMFWQVSLLILVITAIDMVIRKWAWPQVRYALWLLILLKLVISPNWQMQTSLVSRVTPHVEQRILTQLEKTSRIQPTIQDAQFEQNTDLAPPLRNGTISSDNVLTHQSMSDNATLLPKTKPTWKAMGFIIWLVGLILFISLLAMKMSRLKKWHQMKADHTIPQWFHQVLVNTAQRLKLNKIPAIVFAKDAVTPAVYGLFRPVLLLPHGYFNHLSKEEAEHVLLHELCHLKRGDLWLHSICLILQIVYWFNPLLIWTRRQMKHVREICCDISVANILREETQGYRNTLLNTAKNLLTETVEPGLGLLGVFEEPFRLIARLRWLEKKTWEHRKKAFIATLLSSLIVIACFMPMAGIGEPDSVDKVDPLNENWTDKVTQFFEQLSEQSTSKSKYQIQSSTEKWAIVLPVKGSMHQLGVVFEKLKHYTEANDIQSNGHPFTRKYNSEDVVDELELQWEAGFYISDSIGVKAPFKVIRIPERQILEFKFDNEKTDQKAWNIQFSAWLYHNNYITRMPHTLVWTAGFPQTDKPIPFFNVEIEVSKLEAPYPQVDVFTRSLPNRHLLVLPMKGDYKQESQAIQKLNQYIKSLDLERLDDVSIQYHNSTENTAEEDLIWNVMVPISKTFHPEKPFEIQWQHGHQVACTIYEGDHTEISVPFWHSFGLNFSMNGYLVNGLPSKVFREKLDHNNWRVELQWPVNK